MPTMSRNAFGNAWLAVLALDFYVLCLRGFNTVLSPDVSPYHPLGLVPLATGTVTALFWGTIYALRRGRKP